MSRVHGCSRAFFCICRLSGPLVLFPASGTPKSPRTFTSTRQSAELLLVTVPAGGARTRRGRPTRHGRLTRRVGLLVLNGAHHALEAQPLSCNGLYKRQDFLPVRAKKMGGYIVFGLGVHEKSLRVIEYRLSELFLLALFVCFPRQPTLSSDPIWFQKRGMGRDGIPVTGAKTGLDVVLVIFHGVCVWVLAAGLAITHFRRERLGGRDGRVSVVLGVGCHVGQLGEDGACLAETVVVDSMAGGGIFCWFEKIYR